MYANSKYKIIKKEKISKMNKPLDKLTKRKREKIYIKKN
jgi:hypothetical protein